jgi:hypothetical protein
VAGSPPARIAFASACRTLADAVDLQTAGEERTLLPLLAEHLQPGDWTTIARSSRCRLPARDQLLVLGLALEDACAEERARLIEGLPRSARVAWRLHGRSRYRAAAVRLRGAPPAAWAGAADGVSSGTYRSRYNVCAPRLSARGSSRRPRRSVPWWSVP